MAKKSAKKTTGKPSKKPVSVHLSDEEKAVFHRAMLKDHMVDLGPWIAKVVREYIADKADEPNFKNEDERLAYIEKLFEQVKQSIAESKRLQQEYDARIKK